MAAGEDVKAEYDRAMKNALGERRIIETLLTLDMPMYILRDVNINYGGKATRVNCMVFTRKMAFVIECDDIIPENVIDELRQVNNVLSVVVVNIKGE